MGEGGATPRERHRRLSSTRGHRRSARASASKEDGGWRSCAEAASPKFRDRCYRREDTPSCPTGAHGGRTMQQTGREGLRVPPTGARGAKRGAIKTPTGIKRIFQNFFFFGKEPSGFDSTTKCAETVRHRAEGGTKHPRHVCLLSSRRCLQPNVPRSLSPSPTPPSPASALQPDDGIS